MSSYRGTIGLNKKKKADVTRAVEVVHLCPIVEGAGASLEEYVNNGGRSPEESVRQVLGGA
jgi:hypothetical protein